MQKLAQSARAAALALTAVASGMMPVIAQEPEVPVSERPMYGTAAKDSETVKADERMLQETIDRGNSREEVFSAAIRAGWSAYRAGELGIAMRRFNQAWLLDPENGQVYWGFAVAVEARDNNLERAADFMARARARMPQDAALDVDTARLMVRMGKLQAAIDLYKQALELEPNISYADRGLAFAYFGLRDYQRALVHAERALSRGETLPEPFLEDLRTKAQ